MTGSIKTAQQLLNSPAYEQPAYKAEILITSLKLLTKISQRRLMNLPTTL